MCVGNSPELAENLLSCINHNKYDIIKEWVTRNKRNLKKNWRQQKLVATSQLRRYYFCFKRMVLPKGNYILAFLFLFCT